MFGRSNASKLARARAEKNLAQILKESDERSRVQMGEFERAQLASAENDRIWYSHSRWDFKRKDAD